MAFDFDDLDDQGEERAKIKALNTRLLEAMGKGDCWTLLEDVRRGCTNLGHFEQERDEKLGLGSIYRDHDILPGWHASLIDSHKAEDQEIAEQAKKLDKLLHFCPLGPLSIERGDFVEGEGACSGAVSAWLEEEGCYDVRSASGSLAHVKPDELRRLSDYERLLSIQAQLVEVMSAEAGVAALEQCASQCEDAVQYWKRSPDVLQHLTAQICREVAVDIAWYDRMSEVNAEKEEVKQAVAQIKDLAASFNRMLGPDSLEKGSLVELHGLKGEASKLNGTPAVVRDWDGDVRYIVSPLDSAGERKALKRQNIRVIAAMKFASAEDAKACLEALREVYASSSAKDTVSKLEATVPEMRMHAAALRSALLELQRPLLQRFGFSCDAYGQAHLRRSLAEHAVEDRTLTQQFAELEALGQRQLRFDGRVAIVTGGGRGLGRGYCKLLASRGAKVVVNNRTRAKADEVVAEITALGGIAVAEYSNVAVSGEKVIAAALEHFGRFDIIIVNAGQIDDKRFEVMKPDHWTSISDTHVIGHVKLLKAAWPHMVKQSFGRIVVTSSTSGVYGNGGQSNYGAAKMALASLGQTLAMEGYKHGILTNIICPVALTRLTNDVRPEPLRVTEDELHRTPQPVAVPVAYLCHETCKTTAGMFIMEDGHVQALRLQSDEAFVDYDLAAGAAGLEVISSQWPELGDWASTRYPGQALHQGYFSGQGSPGQEAVQNSDAKKPRGAKDLRFDGRIAVVTNAGDGLGRAVCLLLASRGARVYVSDPARDKADAVVTEIVAGGGAAVADYSASGEKAVVAAVEEHDQVDILVVVDGPLPNVAFADLAFDQFQSAFNQRNANSYYAVKAAWPHFYTQKYGRIVLLSSNAAGLFGGVGESQHGATSGALVGMSQCLALEGYGYGILTNAICVEGVASAAVKAQHVAPVVFLCHESSKSTAGMFRAQAGHVQSFRWQADDAFVDFDPKNVSSALEDVGLHWLDEPSWAKVLYPGQALHSSYRPHLQQR